MFSKCKTILTVITMVALLTLALAPVQGQTSETAMNLLLEDIDEAVSELHEMGYSIANIQVDRMGIDDLSSFERTLYAGNEYVIFGIGEYTIADLDLYLYSNTGLLIASDITDDVSALVTVRPSTSKNYSIMTDIFAVNAGVNRQGEFFFATIIAFKSV